MENQPADSEPKVETAGFSQADALKAALDPENQEAPKLLRQGVVTVDSSDPRAQDARQVEREVFMAVFGNSEELMAQEYDPYEPSSKFLVAYNEQEQPVGMMRLIENSEAGFKSLEDLGKEPWNKDPREAVAENIPNYNPDKTLDIATLGVPREYREGGKVANALYHGLAKYSSEHDVDTWVSILDDKVLQRLQRLGSPFRPYAGVSSASYLDSPASTPVWADFKDWEQRLKNDSPRLHAMLFEGEGIERPVTTAE